MLPIVSTGKKVVGETFVDARERKMARNDRDSDSGYPSHSFCLNLFCLFLTCKSVFLFCKINHTTRCSASLLCRSIVVSYLKDKLIVLMVKCYCRLCGGQTGIHD